MKTRVTVLTVLFFQDRTLDFSFLFIQKALCRILGFFEEIYRIQESGIDCRRDNISFSTQEHN